MALELVHGGALIHDDWIDGDSFRRAAPASWEELGRVRYLDSRLMIATGSLHGAISIATGKSLARCIRNLSEGAIADFTDKQNYRNLCTFTELKENWGSLWNCCRTRCVSVITNSSDIPLYKLVRIGRIYQITDDYLDLYNSIATNTPVGDLAIGIPTLPVTRLSKYTKVPRVCR